MEIRPSNPPLSCPTSSQFLWLPVSKDSPKIVHVFVNIGVCAFKIVSLVIKIKPGTAYTKNIPSGYGMKAGNTINILIYEFEKNKYLFNSIFKYYL